MTPAENTITECRGCGAKIFYARSENFADIPLDAKPTKVMVIQPLGPGETQHRCRLVDGFLSHFATCPDADKFRKRKSE